MRSQQFKETIKILLFSAFWFLFSLNAFAQEEKKEPIVVNGDQLEYSQVRQEVTAIGHVVVTYKDSKLICDKAVVNMLTKDCLAQGRVELIDKKGEVEAESMLYNFGTSSGELLQARIVSEPIFGRGAKIKRVNEKEYAVEDGYATTCSYDHPHFRISAKELEFYPQDKVKAKGVALRVGDIPIFYIPSFTHSLKDTVMPAQIQPGKNKDWGYYMLTAWRFNIADDVKMRLLFDERQKLGTAEGFGINYDNTKAGKGDFKFYYTNEHQDEALSDGTDTFERFLVRWRHIWQISENDRITAEFYKIKDAKEKRDPDVSLLKDYFYREFEKDEEPKTYFLYNHIFPNSSFNFFVRKQTTSFFDQIEELPEAVFTMPAYQIGSSPFYFKTNTSFSNMMNQGIDPINNDDLVSRFDTYNQFFSPLKVSFLNINPFLGLRETAYSRDINDESLGPRTAFYSGMELSTKFFRNFGSNFRHIISPFVKYEYISKPTIKSQRLIPFDSIDTLEAESKFTFELTSILQRKRDDNVSNAALFRIFTDYDLKRRQFDGKGFSDINYDVELHPLDWLGLQSDAKYGAKQGYFKEVNVDLSTRLGSKDTADRTFGIGQRYQRGGGKALTSQLIWRINPKWKFSIYERYQFSKLRGTGFEEQEYSISRDLHCWEFDLTYNNSKEHGSTIWFIFRLKAFPEYQFDFNQSYNAPRTANANKSP